MGTKSVKEFFSTCIDQFDNDDFTLTTAVSNHFHKMRYLYNVVCDSVEPKHISFSTFSDTSLTVNLTFKNTKERDAKQLTISTALGNAVCFEQQHFDITVIEDGTLALNISVVNRKVTREDDIHGD